MTKYRLVINFGNGVRRVDFKLGNKVAIVVASSQGLGKATAIELAKEGVDIMLAARSEDKLKEVQQEIMKLGTSKVDYVVTDITIPEQIEHLVSETIKRFGKLDILINNSGGPPSGNFEDLKDEDWTNAFELNLLSYVRIIQAALPHLKKEGGHIINIASSSVKEPIPGLTLSNTLRLGVAGLAKTLSIELAPYNIFVNTIAPGRIATERMDALNEATAQREGRSFEEVRKESEQNIPLRRFGEPEELGKVITFLVSGANTYMTGSTFTVDGGLIKSI